MNDTDWCHVFVSFVGDECICLKCGLIVPTGNQIRSYARDFECVSSASTRAAITRDAIKRHIGELREDNLYTPSILKSYKLSLDWLNSPDPVKALWAKEK